MSKAEAFDVNFGENKSIAIDVNFSKGDAIQVPVSINPLDAEKVADRIADQLQLPEIDTTELAKQGENQEATNTAILDAITNRFVIYNEETGCLTIENVNIKIE
jgi:hypothetical protein